MATTEFKVINVPHLFIRGTFRPLYARPYLGEDKTKEQRRTLVVTNLPLGTTAEGLQEAFADFKYPVQSIELKSMVSTDKALLDPNIPLPDVAAARYSIAYLQFKRSSVITDIMGDSSTLALTHPVPNTTLGVKAANERLGELVEDRDTLLEQAAAVVERFDTREEEKRQQFAEADDEGWITVQPQHGKNYVRAGKIKMGVF